MNAGGLPVVSKAGSIARPIVVGLCVGLLGFLVNLAPVQAGFGLQLLFGGAGAFLVLRMLNGSAALLASSISASATIILWSQPWTFILFLGETAFLVVIRNRTRLDPLVGVPLYWVLLGLPQGLFYYTQALDGSGTVAMAIIANQAINAMVNAAIGSLLASAIVIARPGLRLLFPLSLRRVLLEVLVIFTTIPVLLYSAFSVQDFHVERNASAAERVARASVNAGLRADALLADLTREAEYLSRTLVYQLATIVDPASGLGQIHLPRAVSGIMVGGFEGSISASSGYSDPALFRLAVSRPDSRLQLIASLEAGPSIPVLVLPIHDAEGRVQAVGVAAIDRDRLAEYVLPAAPIPNITVSLLAPDNRVVVTTPGDEDAAAGDGADQPQPFPVSRPGFVTSSTPLALGGWEAVAQYDMGSYQEAYQARMAEFLGGLFVIAAAGVFASAGVARIVTRPLERLSRSIEAAPVDSPRLPFHPVGLKEADALGMALDAASVRTSQYTAANRVLARRLRSLVTHAPVMLYAAEEENGRFVLRYVSPGLQEKLGLRLEPGAAYDRVHERVSVADQPRIAREEEQLLTGGRFDAEYRIQTPSGAEVWVSEVSVLVDDPPYPREVVGVFIDVTTRRALDSRLQQSAKLITLGEMATGLAHELNQPLNVIRMAAQNARRAILRKDDAAAAVLGKLDRIDSQIGRASNLVDHLRIFGRRPEEAFEVFDLRSAVSGALSIVAAQLRPEGIEVEVQLPPSSVDVYGVMQRLEHGIMNIVLNARDAIVASRDGAQRSGNGRVTVAVCTSERGGEIRIADDGGGIDPAILDRLFEPFATTKPPGKGTGLGLSLAYGAVVEMGGQISATNTESGAIFRIVVPLAPSFSDRVAPAAIA